MQPLNLPPVNVDIKVSDNKYQIFDVIRKKFVVLTPEEWVRQHIIHYLLDHHNYSKGLIKLEGGIIYNRLNKRSDILIYDFSGNPYFLIECKAFNIKLNKKVLEQTAVYNHKIQAPFVMITNGMQHFCNEFNAANSSYEAYPSIPPVPAK